MSELEQGQNSASCLPELLEKSGYWDVLMGSVQLWVVFLKALGFGAKCETQAELRAGTAQGGGSGLPAPTLESRAWGQSILCQ